MNPNFHDYVQQILSKPPHTNPLLIPRFEYASSTKNDLLDLKALCTKKIYSVLQNYNRASQCNYNGDPLLFHFYFSQVMYDSIWLQAALQNGIAYDALPVNYLKQLPNDMDRNFISHLFPTVDAEDSNLIKRDFIDWFVCLVEQAEDQGVWAEPKLTHNEIEQFLHFVYRRDFMMNTRPVLGTTGVFRSPTPTRFIKEHELLQDFLESNNIKDIVDLRGERESSRDTQYLWFIEKYRLNLILVDFNELPLDEPALSGYVKKLITRKPAIKTLMLTILNSKGSVLFHCASGKDRTGVMAALIQLLIGFSEEQVIQEYTATGHDAREDRITKVIDYIATQGGIVKYLESCDLTLEQIQQLKQKLLTKVAIQDQN